MPLELTDSVVNFSATGLAIGVPGSEVVATPSYHPAFFADAQSGIFFEPLLPGSRTAIADENGLFTHILPWPSESLPTDIRWTVQLMDGTVWEGAVPEGVSGPVSLQDLQNGYDWAPVDPSVIGPFARGPKGEKGDQGDPGEKGDKGDTGDPGLPDPTGQNGKVLTVVLDSPAWETPTGGGGSGSGFVSIRDTDFLGGAKGDGVTDDRPAILDAISKVSATRGSILYFPTGDYLCSGAIVIDRSLRLFGEFGERPNGGARILTQSGSHGIFVRGATDGSITAIIENLYLIAQGRETAVQKVATWSSGQNITVDSTTGLDIDDGVMLAAAGHEAVMWGLRATTTAGNPAVTMALLGGTQGITPANAFVAQDLAQGNVGTRIRISGVTFGAGKAHTHVIAASGSTITLADAPNQSVSNAGVFERNPWFGRIINIPNATTITVDATDGSTAVSGELLMRDDCGIYAQSRVKLVNVTTENFLGSGFHVRASLGYSPVSTALSCYLEDCVSNACQVGICAVGATAHNGHVRGGDFSASRTWNFIDATTRGWTFENFRATTANSKAFKTTQRAGVTAQRTKLDSVYATPTAYSYFSFPTLVDGGDMGNNQGAKILGPGPIGSPYLHHGPSQFGDAIGSGQSYSDYEVQILPEGIEPPVGVRSSLARIAASLTKWPGGTPMKYAKTIGGSDGLVGWWTLIPDAGGIQRCAMMVADKDADGGGGVNGGAGQVMFPHPVRYGSTDTGIPTLTTGGYLEEWANAVPTGANYYGGAWKAGDRIKKKVPVVAGSAGSQTMIVGWICTVGGIPGTWKEVRSWAEDPTGLVLNVGTSLKEFNVAAGTTVPFLFPFSSIPSGGANYVLFVHIRITASSGPALRINYSYADTTGSVAKDLLAAGTHAAGTHNFSLPIFGWPSAGIAMTVFDNPALGNVKLTATLARVF